MERALVALLILSGVAVAVCAPIVVCIVGMVLYNKQRIAAYEAEADRQERTSRVVSERLAGNLSCDPTEDV
jgi:hypothetical protein